MSTVTFHPSRLTGIAAVPPAKSEAHRALLLAALGQTPCVLHGFAGELCDDTLAMMAGINALGGTVTREGEDLRVVPAPPAAPNRPMTECRVNSCAAALRMLLPVFLARGQKVRFLMTAGLLARPLDAFEPLLNKIGGKMTRGDSWVEVEGTMAPGAYEIDGSLSSQFASGLLIALSRTGQAPSTLTVTGPIVSRPYLDMTLAIMKRFHVPFTEAAPGVFQLPGGEEGPVTETHVDGDWSQAAVFLCANALGSGVMIKNLETEECLQGDAAVMDVLRSMGMRMVRNQSELYAVCPSHARLSAVTVDCTPIPDVAPILALTCSQAKGVSRLTGVSRLKAKECDRLEATMQLLALLGVQTETDGETLTIYGGGKLTGGFEADARSDHRMVMLLAVAALSADKPITVHGADSLNKSWPAFLQTYQELGGIVQ